MQHHAITRRRLLQQSLQAFKHTHSDQTDSKELLPFFDEGGITPTDHFYRQHLHHVPQITAVYWMLRIHGMVEKPYTLDYNRLIGMEKHEQTYTLMCIGNSSRNPMISTARWSGVPMQAILNNVSISPATTHAQLFAADGYTTYVEIETLENAFLAFGMNGEPLPPEHGYPVRLIVPGRYGYKMPKWIQRIEFTDQPVAGFWETRGSSATGEVPTMTSIFSPRHLEQVGQTVQIAGAAYAGARTITGVDVSINDSPWMPVPIQESLPYQWTPWRINWTASTPGDALIKVRATDSEGFTQADSVAGNYFPKRVGSLHSVIVRVSE